MVAKIFHVCMFKLLKWKTGNAETSKKIDVIQRSLQITKEVTQKF